jgi:hypothetical protein
MARNSPARSASGAWRRRSLAISASSFSAWRARFITLSLLELRDGSRQFFDFRRQVDQFEPSGGTLQDDRGCPDFAA